MADEKNYFFLRLANGDTVTVEESEVPGYAGTNAPHGFHNDVPVTDVYPAPAPAPEHKKTTIEGTKK